MLWASRDWAAARDVETAAHLSPDLVEIFARFLLDPSRPGREKKGPLSCRSAADYLERARWFAARGGLLDAETEKTFVEIVGALRDVSSDQEPAKRTLLRQFREKYTLADVLHAAVRMSRQADALPACSAEAARLRRGAMILALLVNTADRQGDLSTHRIGRELRRRPDGLWDLDFDQGKGGRRKDNGPLWAITSRLIDKHVLGDRPDWLLDELLLDLEGMNLISLAPEGRGLYYPTAVLKRVFGISGHLVRSLITDAVRVHRPDAAWAAQFLLGHSNRRMQETYRTDFRNTSVMKDYHEALEELRTVRFGPVTGAAVPG